MYFYRRRNMVGVWVPEISDVPPAEKGPEGQVRKIRDLAKIPDHIYSENLPLETLGRVMDALSDPTVKCVYIEKQQYTRKA